MKKKRSRSQERRVLSIVRSSMELAPKIEAILKITRAQALELPGGSRRLWLEDADEVTIRGRAVREGYVSIGFGECTGRVAPAQSEP